MEHVPQGNKKAVEMLLYLRRLFMSAWALGSRVSDPIRLLCNDMKSSELYMKSLVDVSIPEAPLSTALLSPQMDKSNHRSKSDQLRQLLDDYTSNPSHAAIRNRY